MRIKRHNMPVLVIAGVAISIGLALLLALFAGAGTAAAVEVDGDGQIECNGIFGSIDACTGNLICWGPGVMEIAGCYRARVTEGNPEECCNGGPTGPSIGDSISIGIAENGCYPVFTCPESKQISENIWLADVCEPDDGFSANGEMTLDSNTEGPLEIGSSFDGPWFSVEVNGPPWVVTEEMLESFAEMAGVEDWHDLWVRSGDGYPQHLGNMILERDGRMDLLCAE